jgi:tetratricopeptide (TPR) repeat protein
VDIYDPDTKYTDIREGIQKFVTDHPSEPFIEFLHYTIGDLDKAIAANPNSVIVGAIKYASGHRILAALLKETRAALKLKDQDEYGSEYTVYWTLNKLDEEPELYGNKLLSDVIPDFASKAAAARPYFEAVLQDASSIHRDDAGYMLAWLAVHQGDPGQAKKYLSQTLNSKEGDWRYTALREMMDLLERSPANEQVAFVESEPPFAQEAAPWYFIARESYRNFDYAKAIETAERGLRMLQVPPEDLPATTDPEKITEAIDKILPETRDLNLYEMGYLIEASREMLRYDGDLKALAGTSPEEMAQKTRAIVTKYSLLVDPAYTEDSNGEASSDDEQTSKPAELIHRDLRQAAHLIEIALAALPRTEEYRALREWLYYRKVRIMVQFAPGDVPGVVSAMAQEFPSSQLLDDALGEQLYTQGAVLRNRNAAEDTLQRILVGFPQGNAVDNALNWMAVIYRCEGLTAEADKIDGQLIQQFPLTRHGRNALLRITNPSDWSCDLKAFEKHDE